MEKIVLWSLLSVGIFASSPTLENDCLSCHMMQKIPNDLIYKRYLITYSTKEKIEDAIVKYLKDPQKVNSIMPPQFFLKFPIKKLQNMDDQRRKENVKAYIEKFDVQKRLILEKNSH